MDQKNTHLHFVGIGGIGMSGIAQVFFNQGYRVSGSDLSDGEAVRRLRSLGITVYIGHHSENVSQADVVIISSAVRATNPEVLEAKRRRVPVIPRAEMLGELMRGKTGIAVAGTHGKTTTTSMLAMILTVAGRDPTSVIGGRVDSLGGNAKLGQSSLVVAEADESDGSFLHLPATYAIVTNIDNDHMDHFKTPEALEQAFVDLIGKLPFYGVAAVCAEDPTIRRCLERFTKPVLTYGFSAECDYRAEQVHVEGLGSRFLVYERPAGQRAGAILGQIQLHVPGRHNVLNALAAIAISRRVGLSFDQIEQGLKAFRGVARRFEIRWSNSNTNQVIVDDYGHHPTEIEATLAAARVFWPGRVLCLFQPHRYSRTALCYDGFMQAFGHADEVLITDIYSAGEDPIEGVSAQKLVTALQRVVKPGQKIAYVGGLQAALQYVLTVFQKGDLLLCMGAGSITKLPDSIIEKLGPMTVKQGQDGELVH